MRLQVVTSTGVFFSFSFFYDHGAYLQRAEATSSDLKRVNKIAVGMETV